MYVDIELDAIIEVAHQKRASDIHFDTTQLGLEARFRCDGLLSRYETIDRAYQEQMINRIKVLSGMDISEKRIPQDGRWKWNRHQIQEQNIGDKKFIRQGISDYKEITMRVSSMPSIYGETIVCRLMGNEGSYKSLVELGMSEELYTHVQELLKRPYGLLTINGPTGAGKSATLYSMLMMLPRSTTKLICLEDPVEADIEGAIQVGINEKIGLTFSKGLRAILRQDPDSIMIGEIRDNETARLAVQAALTGHRVLSTIHTNTSLGVIDRLQYMGVEPYLIKATLMGAIAQRLVRKLDGNGQYSGRTALFELMEVPMQQPNWHMPDEFMVTTLEVSAKSAIEQGITSLEEVQRVGLLI